MTRATIPIDVKAIVSLESLLKRAVDELHKHRVAHHCHGRMDCGVEQILFKTWTDIHSRLTALRLTRGDTSVFAPGAVEPQLRDIYYALRLDDFFAGMRWLAGFGPEARSDAARASTGSVSP